MKKIIITILLALFICPIFAANFSSSAGDIKLSADVMQMGKQVVKAKNKVNLKAKPDEKSFVDIKCNNFKLDFMESQEISLKSVKSASFSDNVIIKFDVINDGVKSTCLTYSNSAFFDGSTQDLILTGNVKIDYISADGTKMSADGQKATVNFNSSNFKDGIAFAIEGDSENKTNIGFDMNQEEKK